MTWWLAWFCSRRITPPGRHAAHLRLLPLRGEMVDWYQGGVDLIAGRVDTAYKRPGLSNRVTPRRLPSPGRPSFFPLSFGLPSSWRRPGRCRFRRGTGHERIDVGNTSDKAVLKTQANGNLMALAAQTAVPPRQHAVDQLRRIAVESRPSADGKPSAGEFLPDFRTASQRSDRVFHRRHKYSIEYI